MTDGTNNGIDGYSQTRVGDHTILTPKDKKASVYQKVTPREQYAVARDVANRAINEINAIRADRPSSFTGGINDANIAARMQAAETYGDTLPSRRPSSSFRPIVGIGSDVPVRGTLIDADRVSATAPQISEIRGDWGYGPSIRYPEPDAQTIPDDTTPDDTTPDDTTPNENPWWREKNDYNWDLRQDQGWSGTRWDSPRDDADIYGTGSFARTNWLTDQFKTAAGDDNNLSYDEYVKGITTRPDDNAYNPYTMANALANYWATSGATVDKKALDAQNLFLQGDNLIQKLGTGDVGPNLALSDYVKFDKRVDDGDDDYFTYYNWSRKK
tara:strand:- start:1625 stop:2605 length:981 start_codon:yes stop_codon:yes gene_type:complete